MDWPPGYQVASGLDCSSLEHKGLAKVDEHGQVVDNAMNTGYVIFIHTLIEGDVPSFRGDGNKPFVFATEVEAQREIVDNHMTRLQEFMDGERDFEDAMTVEEFVVKVRVRPDGSILDECGTRFT